MRKNIWTLFLFAHWFQNLSFRTVWLFNLAFLFLQGQTLSFLATSELVWSHKTGTNSQAQSNLRPIKAPLRLRRLRWLSNKKKTTYKPRYKSVVVDSVWKFDQKNIQLRAHFDRAGQEILSSLFRCFHSLAPSRVCCFPRCRRAVLLGRGGGMLTLDDILGTRVYQSTRV